ITPIPYDSAHDHALLLRVLTRWADISAINGKRRTIDSEIRRILKTDRSQSTDADRDLFDHLVRRADPKERIRISSLGSKAKADFAWLSAIMAIEAEPRP